MDSERKVDLAVPSGRYADLSWPQRLLVTAFVVVGIWYLAWRPGTFNPDTLDVTLHKEPQLHSEDLLNLAALFTLTNGGDVWLLAPEHVPSGNQIAAALRY